ncbi:hypothetical protein RYH80_18005 [Halobaculum sp. MBLA0147]|uniref:hypothetical protein n=1 Tax=Halobaculum sp. MBLA0147 TaxID=3079934 RepID=UPI0035259529
MTVHAFESEGSIGRFTSPEQPEGIDVPATFDSDVLHAEHGHLPQEWYTQMVFVRNGTLRAAAIVNKDKYVEAVYKQTPADPTFGSREWGWVGYVSEGDYEDLTPGDVPADELKWVDDNYIRDDEVVEESELTRLGTSDYSDDPVYRCPRCGDGQMEKYLDCPICGWAGMCQPGFEPDRCPAE